MKNTEITISEIETMLEELKTFRLFQVQADLGINVDALPENDDPECFAGGVYSPGWMFKQQAC